MALIGEMQYLTIGENTYSIPISGGSTVSITRSLTSGTKSATISVDGTNYDLYAPTPNAGTVTSVRVQANLPVQSSTSTAQSSTLNTTISLADAYGDTKNPYGTKAANYVLAGPTSGSAAIPNFRKLVAADIPDLSGTYLTSAPVTSVNGSTGAVVVTEGLEPLIGTTETVTPQQVMTALSEGRDICISTSYSLLSVPATLRFTSWNRATDGLYDGAGIDLVVSQTIVCSDGDYYLFELQGGVLEGVSIPWTVTNANLSTFSGSYNDLADKPTIPDSLSDLTDDLGSSPIHTHSQYLTSHQDISGKQDVLTEGDGIDITSNVISNTQGIEYIVGTQAASTNAWTGVSKDTTLKTGKIIAYKLPYAGTSTAATLNLTMADGTTTGAKALRRTGSSTVTTQFAVDNVIILVYDGTYWQVSAYYDSNSNTVPTGYCTTAASTAKKVVTCTYGYRDDTAYFPCLFRYANTATNATLFITTYAETELPIYVNGARTTSNNTFGRGVTMFLYYNNAYYCYNDGRFPIVVDGTVTSIQDVLTSKAAASGGTDLSLVTTGEKYNWDNKSNFSGSYNDLTNKPTIPSNTSDLTNDSGFITDAGVTSFNGSTGAVTYTAPVTSVNGSTGAVTVSVPTQTSDLTNNSGFITTSDLGSYTTKVDVDESIRSVEVYATDATSQAILSATFSTTTNIIVPSDITNLLILIYIYIDPRTWFAWMNNSELEMARLGVSVNTATNAVTLYLRGRTSIATGIMGVDSSWTVTQYASDAEGWHTNGKSTYKRKQS